MQKQVAVIGAGLAGGEAAWQLAERGIEVTLFEMKPSRFSPAHKSPDFAELVCSNSFRSDSPNNAVGLLKDEMRSLSSLVMKVAMDTRVPAGKALAVDRKLFSKMVTERLNAHKFIKVVRQEIKSLDEIKDGFDAIVVATGPLTSPDFECSLRDLTGRDYLYFYDSIAPLVEADSLDITRGFGASRYGYGGDADYLNFPFTRDEYYGFVTALSKAQKVKTHEFDEPRFFEGCMPIETIAEKGPDTLRHGPMKPMGLRDPKTQKIPFAVAQLRQDNLSVTLYNMVGFQSRMTRPEQDRVFRMIPGFESVRFARYGSMHRNTFINGPALLDECFRLKGQANLYFVGQIIGVEGYVESAASGLYVGRMLSLALKGYEDLPPPPTTTAIGALIRHVTRSNPKTYQPSNIIFGLMPSMGEGYPKSLVRLAMIDRARGDFDSWQKSLGA